MPVLDTNTLEEYILRYQVDGVIWKADTLLHDNKDNPILQNARFIEVAGMLSCLPEGYLREDYMKKISKKHDITLKTLEKMVADHVVIKEKKQSLKKAVRKNKIATLEGDPRTFQFFTEVVTMDKDTEEYKLSKIKINKLKFVQLLSSFGFTRYELNAESKTSGDDTFEFVRLRENVMSLVTRQQIIDYIEHFVLKEYDFKGAGYRFVGPEELLEEFYDEMRTIFNKDLFARVRNGQPVIISKDTQSSCFLYYKNVFVEITKDGWDMRNYADLNGSVWDTQMSDRTFAKLSFQDLNEMGYFADFCYLVSNKDPQRFKSLCSIIGYLVHDYYQYKLKSVLLTDSALSEESEGRSGKTLLLKVVGLVRSFVEINGKEFDSSNEKKYQNVQVGTQIVHINDIQHKGRFKFDFENMFNDITEGIMVKQMYLKPFRAMVKLAISTNRTLNIKGGSQRDRIIEFEFSDFFHEGHSPADYYEHWFIRDWKEDEFNRFDNFICYCVQTFLGEGLLEANTINLAERKLLNHTAPEFLEYFDDIRHNIEKDSMPWTGYTSMFNQSTNIRDYEFDTKVLYDRFLYQYSDFKDWLKQRKFNEWIAHLAEVRYGVKHLKKRKSNGQVFIQFVEQ